MSTLVTILGILVPFILNIIFPKPEIIRFENLKELSKLVEGCKYFSTSIDCYDTKGNLYPSKMETERLIEIFEINGVVGNLIKKKSGKVFARIISNGTRMKLYFSNK